MDDREYIEKDILIESNGKRIFARWLTPFELPFDRQMEERNALEFEEDFSSNFYLHRRYLNSSTNRINISMLSLYPALNLFSKEFVH